MKNVNLHLHFGSDDSVPAVRFSTFKDGRSITIYSDELPTRDIHEILVKLHELSLDLSFILTLRADPIFDLSEEECN